MGEGVPASPLAALGATRATLEGHGLAAKYALGQNFLVDDGIVRRILDLSGAGPDDAILEVGPGIGTLTYALLATGAQVMAVEKDADLPAVLAETLAPVAGRFSLIRKDALDLAVDDLPVPPSKLVANLPYAVAATVVLDCFQRLEGLDSATVMVQKEVADRMAARPGTKAYGAYTVKLALYARPTGRFGVAPGCFFPPPRVDSAVIRLDREPMVDAEGRPASPQLLAAACTMADAAFAHRRKTLANSARTYLAGRGPEGAAAAARLPEILAAAGIDGGCRGEALAPQSFIALGRALLEMTP